MKKLLIILLLQVGLVNSQQIVVTQQGNNISIKSSEESEKTIKVFDILGKEVLEKTTPLNSNYNINLNELQIGIYLIIVSDGVNEEVKKIRIDNYQYLPQNHIENEKEITVISNSISPTTELPYGATLVSFGLGYSFKSNSILVQVGFPLIKSVSLSGGIGYGYSNDSPTPKGRLLNSSYNWGNSELRESSSGYTDQFFIFIDKKVLKNISIRLKYGEIWTETIGYFQKYQQWHYQYIDAKKQNIVGGSILLTEKGWGLEIGGDKINGVTLGLSYTL